LLSFEEKHLIFLSFPELTETKISKDRINFKYRSSKKKGKVLACELHPSGNGYVCGKYMDDYPVDDRGWVRIKDYTENELKTIIRKAIDSMSK
jgi:hypothetical protein